jgi:hypothetical protein
VRRSFGNFLSGFPRGARAPGVAPADVSRGGTTHGVDSTDDSGGHLVPRSKPTDVSSAPHPYEPGAPGFSRELRLPGQEHIPALSPPVPTQATHPDQQKEGIRSRLPFSRTEQGGQVAGASDDSFTKEVAEELERVGKAGWLRVGSTPRATGAMDERQRGRKGVEIEKVMGGRGEGVDMEEFKRISGIRHPPPPGGPGIGTF